MRSLFNLNSDHLANEIKALGPRLDFIDDIKKFKESEKVCCYPSFSSTFSSVFAPSIYNYFFFPLTVEGS